LSKVVIPDLIRNPVFSTWIPAGVYPDGNRGKNDRIMVRGSILQIGCTFTNKQLLSWTRFAYGNVVSR
jgi:hypothetical protein